MSVLRAGVYGDTASEAQAVAGAAGSVAGEGDDARAQRVEVDGFAQEGRLRARNSPAGASALTKSTAGAAPPRRATNASQTSRPVRPGRWSSRMTGSIFTCATSASASAPLPTAVVV